MATEIKVWEVINESLQEIESDDLASENLEKDLETWVTNNPSLLGGKLLAIKRQHEVPQVGILDLICIDENGRLAVIEFKRSLTSREAVAQALDYASWLDATSEAEIRSLAQESLGKPIEDAFLDHFGSELQSLAPQNHRILLVAPRLDSSAERIIDYLADRHGVDINAIFFRYAKTSSGQKILVRTVLVQDRPGQPAVRSWADEFTVPKLLAMASDRKVLQLVEVCRTVSPDLEEVPWGTFKGSFRYWMQGRMFFGVNVSGGRDRAPTGELHVWIPPKTIAELSGIPESEIRDCLKNSHGAYEAGATDMIVRLQNVDQAKLLADKLRKWAAVVKAGATKAAAVSAP
jgi:hypothetical protein